MERLWTPWRMNYVGGPKQAGCVFCDALSAGDDAGRLVLFRGTGAGVILNLFPYNSGHAMVVPFQHAADLDALDGATRAEMFELATTLVNVSKRVFRCDGFNLGLNLGAVAGAGVAEHLHLHVVPRWTGDANFMPILAGTTVMPELLPVTYARLRAELEGTIAERERGVILEAGGLVVLPERGLVALRRGRDGGVALPKGHVEPGETLAQTAIREVREETGIDATIVGWLGSDEFRYPPDDSDAPLIYSAYFIMLGAPTAELDDHLKTDTVLAPVAGAAAHVTVPALRALIERATPALANLSDPR